jgi:uncharacterized integral membrane protein
MRTKLLLTTVIVLLFGVLALANRGVLSGPVTMNLLFSEVHASLGLILLAALAVVIVAYLSLLAATERAALIAQTRMSREIERLRQIIEQNEETSIADLRRYTDRQFVTLHERLDRIAARQEAPLSAEHPSTLPPNAVQHTG